MSSPATSFDWIRGVNLNGWLVLKRFITPYLFAVTTCDLAGNYCQYPGQLGSNLSLPFCDYAVCPPALVTTQIPDPMGGGGILDVQAFAEDEFTLLEQFSGNPPARRAYVEQHYDNFVSQADIQTLRAAGVSHIKIPVGHWIVGDRVEVLTAYNNTNYPPSRNDILVGPWVAKLGWTFLLRLIGWCRIEGIQVWLEMDSLPGWDRPGTDCSTWSTDIPNMDLSTFVIAKLVDMILADGLHDVITGLVVLPSSVNLTHSYSVYGNGQNLCDVTLVGEFYNITLDYARRVLGPNFAVVVGPAGIDPVVWNEQHVWQSPNYTNTYMTSDYNQVFASSLRGLSPRQHIAYACETAVNDLAECCWSTDYYNDTAAQPIPSIGVSRVVGAWSGGYDTDVFSLTAEIMRTISLNGTNPFLSRQVSPQEIQFLGNYIKAQMVAYEFAEAGISHGWFFETMKTEGGAFAEWDFLRGLQEGWIPNPLPPLTQASDASFGTCESLLFSTVDNMAIVQEYPPPAQPVPGEPVVVLNDDVVLSHGDSLQQQQASSTSPYVEQQSVPVPGVAPNPTQKRGFWARWFPFLAVGFFVYAVKRVFFNSAGRRRQYEPVRSIGLTV